MTDDHNPDMEIRDRDKNIHFVWDNSLEPILTVEPGDVVRFECRVGNNNDITPDSDPDEIPELDPRYSHPLAGPVAIEGAQPGDTLTIDILELEHKGWGWTGYWPADANVGLLPEEFEDPGLHIWDLEDDIGHFVDGIEVPLDPFPGCVGVAPGEDGQHDTIPPRHVGGNIDIKHLTSGSTVYLPVEVPTGLFSIGDCHAAQGDGEVCLTGIEAPMDVTVRLGLRKDVEIEQPAFETDHPFTPTGSDETMYGTTGISNDLMDATRKAVLHMINHLHRNRGLSRGEAYMLCSAIVDLKINEVVDDPNWVVSAYLPECIFPA